MNDEGDDEYYHDVSGRTTLSDKSQGEQFVEVDDRSAVL